MSIKLKKIHFFKIYELTLLKNSDRGSLKWEEEEQKQNKMYSFTIDNFSSVYCVYYIHSSRKGTFNSTTEAS